jgi:hypothetical protein
VFEIPSDLHPDCVPLGFLLGTWVGVGVGGYPTIEGFRFGQQLDFGHVGKPFLTYTSRSWLLDEDGNRVRPLAMETGFWRPQPNREVELVLAHPTGIVEIYLGEIDGAKVELRTDVVARTSTAKEYASGHRLYGLVESELLWAYDMSAMGESLQPHLSARLRRET